MTLVLEKREYQEEAVGRSLEFLMRRKQENGIVILPCGAGKSIVAARIALGLDAPAILFQPRKELLEQNLAKLRLYGFEPAVFSASMGRREVGEITLATIKSIVDYSEYFQDVRYVLIDECSEVNPAQGQYKKFFKALHPKTKYLGLDATPFRRYSNSYGTELRFLTRQVPRLFNKVVHFTQLQELFEQGYLSPLEYFSMRKEVPFDQGELDFKDDGSDYTDESVQRQYSKIGFAEKLVDVVKRLMVKERRGILVFTRFTKEAKSLASAVPGVAVVSSKTSDSERESILERFKGGEIKAVANVGLIGIGFDYPRLDTCVLARPTLSLRVFYQQIGRIVRPHPDKPSGWVIDLVGNLKTFGRLEHLRLYCEGASKWSFFGRPGGGAEKQLTNCPIGEAWNRMICKKCMMPIFYSRHEVTANSATLSKPLPGGNANIVLRTNAAGKTVYAIPRPSDPDYGQREYVQHRLACNSKVVTQ